MRSIRFTALAAMPLATFTASLKLCPADAHGFAGERFFPATILTDDPSVADEMSLPTFIVNPPGHPLSKGGFR